MDALTLREKLDAALTEVSAAEAALHAVLGELEQGARADKVTITTAVQEAFERLRVSRKELATLRELATRD